MLGMGGRGRNRVNCVTSTIGSTWEGGRRRNRANCVTSTIGSTWEGGRRRNRVNCVSSTVGNTNILNLVLVGVNSNGFSWL